MKILYRFALFSFYIFLFSCSTLPTKDSKKEPENDQSNFQFKKKTLNLANEITITDIHKAHKNKEYTVSELTDFYLRRIDSLNKKGPELRAIITVNPDALQIAQQLDQQLDSTTFNGALFGIPVVLKDNIDTGDKMPNTAGAKPLADLYPSKDSPLVQQLRKAGAVILGKANLSEWANFHSTFSSSGWSAVGGQTKNPYILDRNPCGSSSGSAVAVAANLCVIGIGTETDGSIICPANNCGVVGIKPTVGLISRTGIIPISFWHDTPGPFARTVRDAAISLGTMTAKDSEDSRTTNPTRKAYQDYTPFLNKNGLKGKTIGYWRQPAEDNAEVLYRFQTAVDYMKSQGATLIEVSDLMSDTIYDYSFKVMKFEFKEGLDSYLNQVSNPYAPDLKQVIAKTLSDPESMQYFDHELLRLTQYSGHIDQEEYLKALQSIKAWRENGGINKVMNAFDLDAIIAPSGGPAWVTDMTQGDAFDISSSSPAAIAGFPNISLPMGEVDGLPIGLSIFGREWSEPILIEIAYAYEQSTFHRMTPQFIPTLEQ